MLGTATFPACPCPSPAMLAGSDRCEDTDAALGADALLLPPPPPPGFAWNENRAETVGRGRAGGQADRWTGGQVGGRTIEQAEVPAARERARESARARVAVGHSTDTHHVAAGDARWRPVRRISERRWDECLGEVGVSAKLLGGDVPHVSDPDVRQLDLP